jgi:hypothetical protein
LRLAPLLLVVAACGGASAPASSPSPVVEKAPAARPPLAAGPATTTASCEAAEDCSRLGVELAKKRDPAALLILKKGCDGGALVACTNLGLVGKMKLAAGCLLVATDKESKGNATTSALTASKVTVDGTTFPSVECSLAEGSPFAILTIAKGISSQRRALDGCVKKATETPVDVTSAGGKFTSVRASGPDATVNRCVERAIAGKAAGLAGSCKLVVAHGR